jgi:hypothetical protein
MKTVEHKKLEEVLTILIWQLKAKNGTATFDVIQERAKVFTATVQYYRIESSYNLF